MEQITRDLQHLLCIDSDVLRELDCTELIDDFAQLKCRKRDLSVVIRTETSFRLLHDD